MSLFAPIELLLDRLAPWNVREVGPGRWRARCPVCGGRNPTKISVGLSDSGAVMFTPFCGCDKEAVLRSLGLDWTDIMAPRGSHGHPARPRRMLSSWQALTLLDEEMTLAIVCMSDMAAGSSLDDRTRARLLQAAARVSLLRAEAAS